MLSESRTREDAVSAILVATAAADDGSPAALLSADGEDTLIGHFAGQLLAHGVGAVSVLTRPEWHDGIAKAVPHANVSAVESLGAALDAVGAAAAGATGALVLAHAEIVTHDAVLAGLLRDPRVATGAVTGRVRRIDQPTMRVRLQRGRIVAAESPYHSIGRGPHSFLGLLKISPADRRALAEAATAVADLCRTGVAAEWDEQLAEKVRSWQQRVDQAVEASSPEVLSDQGERDARFAVQLAARAAPYDVVSLCLVGLVRGGHSPPTTQLRELYWARPLSQSHADRARLEMSRIDEDVVMLDSAVKASDGFFTTFFVSPYSRYLARWSAARGFTPNQVTVFSMLLGVLAAAAFAVGTRPGLVAGAVLLQLAFTADCVDGQLARYTRQFSRLGAWLDSVFDRAKEYVVFPGLALGAARAGDDVWLLAVLALALQTTRHAIDFSFAATAHQVISTSRRLPVAEVHERPVKISEESLDSVEEEPAAPATGVVASLRRVAGSASRMVDRGGWTKWLKRIIIFPIGERFALISLTAAVFHPRITFVAFLIWGVVAAAYAVTGRLLRTVA